MNRDDVIRMAREAGGYDGFTSSPTDWDNGDFVISPEQLERFAALVEAATKEKCAVAVERARLYLDGNHGLTNETDHIGEKVVQHCVEAIRNLT